MNNRKPRAGLLPLYIKIYDDSTPFMREVVDRHVAAVAERIRGADIDVTAAPVCRVKAEFTEAVTTLESADVDFIITLNAAYSPSLESYEAIAASSLPVFVLDTTFDYEFTPESYADGMLYNHGIHGVMDLCNMLRRAGRPYEIMAGYFDEKNPDFDKLRARLKAFADAAQIKKALHKTRVGIVGEPFEGMGDFRIPFDVLKEKLGITVVSYDMEQGEERLKRVTDADIDAEYALDSERFEMRMSRDAYTVSARAALAVRSWLVQERLDAFTMNFNSAKRGTGFPTMPFAEASIAMSRGIGYAGEGDVMTAAFVAALMKVFPEVSFTEIFCPDWKNDTLFVSHMGEYNVALSSTARKPVMSEKEFTYGNADNPAVVLAPFKPGRVVYVSLNPGPDNTFDILYMPGEMLAVPFENQQSYVVNGWFKPDVPLAEFLESYSRAGGIHHAALIYGGDEVVAVLENLRGMLS